MTHNDNENSAQYTHATELLEGSIDCSENVPKNM